MGLEQPNGWTFECKVHFRSEAKGRKRLRAGETPAPEPVPMGRLPHVAKLLALAHRFEGLVRSGAVRDYAELARVTGVTRARMTQLMNLLLLAPGIQQEVLDIPRVGIGRDPVTERDLRPIAAEPDWQRQQRMWNELQVRISRIEPPKPRAVAVAV